MVEGNFGQLSFFKDKDLRCKKKRHEVPEKVP
jgi:hypothetical protein